MSAALRHAIRAFLRDVEDEVRIDDDSPLGDVRRLLRVAERATSEPEPADLRAAELQIARLVEALAGFKKNGGHFVGCPADKDGRICAPTCRVAQAALSREVRYVTEGTVDALVATITALEHERRELLRLVAKLEMAANLVKRPRGRPRKHPIGTAPPAPAGLGTRSEIALGDGRSPGGADHRREDVMR